MGEVTTYGITYLYVCVCGCMHVCVCASVGAYMYVFVLFGENIYGTVIYTNIDPHQMKTVMYVLLVSRKFCSTTNLIITLA